MLWNGVEDRDGELKRTSYLTFIPIPSNSDADHPECGVSDISGPVKIIRAQNNRQRLLPEILRAQTVYSQRLLTKLTNLCRFLG